jgi:hypothetical protein
VNSILLLLYLVAAIWAVMESGERWATLLWVIVSLVALIGGCMLLSLVFLSLVVPRYALDFVDLAAVIGMFVSAVVGLTHMKAHRRIAAPKV